MKLITRSGSSSWFRMIDSRPCKKSLAFILLGLFAMSNILSFVLATPAQAAGATLFFSPSSKAVTVGSSFSISVMVNTGSGSINTLESIVNFPTDLLKVNSLALGGSIVSMWVPANPVSSNAKGTITFGGGMLSPYTGTNGRVLSISFKALKSGNAKLSFSNSQILTGPGENAFGSAGSSAITITEPEAPKIEQPKPVVTTPSIATTTPINTTALPEDSTVSTQPKGVLPPAPEVTSPSHADKDIWYANNKVQLDWRLLASITALGYSFDNIASTTPPEQKGAIIQTKTYDKLADGRHYFHIRLQNKVGWGPVANRQVLIDTVTPVKPILTVDNGGDSTNPSQIFKIATYDVTSGIAKIKFWLNGAEKIIEPLNEIIEPYQLEKLLPGNYSINLIAYDRAGNNSSSSISFSVDPLKAPIITDIPKEIKTLDNLSIRGSSFYPNSTITVSIGLVNGDPVQAEVKTDDNGNWSYYHPVRLNRNNYEVWAKVTDARGAQSLNSIKVGLAVTSPEIIAVWGLYIILFLFAVIAFLVLYIYQLKKSYNTERLHAIEETQGAQKKINEIFLALHEEVNELIEYADKKAGLSESERRVKEKLEEALDISEEFLIKEIEDIEKEVFLPKVKKK